MSLSFPNPTRSYNERNHCVRFFGHDGTKEIAFRVDVVAFSTTSRASGDEAAFLAAFDAVRIKIQSVAREAYSNGRMLYYALSARDFK